MNERGCGARLAGESERAVELLLELDDADVELVQDGLGLQSGQTLAVGLARLETEEVQRRRAG